MTGSRLAKPRWAGLQPSLALLVGCCLATQACRSRQPTVVLQPARGASVAVSVEIAETPESQARGLMYRNHLDPDRGMLFLFREQKRHPFWMKNTLIPLDLIFIARDGRIVGIHPNAEPFSLKPIDGGAPSQAVLEVNGGFAAEHGLAVGDRAAYRDVRTAKLP
jgi:uncharacterized membrane protein (UPF0127 family)